MYIPFLCLYLPNKMYIKSMKSQNIFLIIVRQHTQQVISNTKKKNKIYYKCMEKINNFSLRHFFMTTE